MSAVFGRLQGSISELRPGLNILQAEESAVLSDWAAFIPAMFYGPDRSDLARGRCVSGRLDWTEDAQEYILARVTRRPADPMGEFLCAYAESHLPVPGLDGRNCGEALLKLSRETYQRSAFLYPDELRVLSGRTWDQPPASYPEAMAALRLHLSTARRSSTEYSAAAQAKLDTLTQLRSDSDHLRQQLTQTRARLHTLSRQEQSLQQELETLRLLDDAQFQQQLSDAGNAVLAAQERADAMQRQLLEDHIPDNDTIRRLRGAIVNLETVRKALDKARLQRDEAMKALLQAETAAAESPFAGKSPESARHVPAALPAVSWPLIIVPPLAGAAAGALIGAFALSSILSSAPLTAALAGAVLGGFISLFHYRSRKKAAGAILSAYHVSTPPELSRAAEAYSLLCQTQEAAQADCDRCRAEADDLYATLSSNEQAILLEIRRFAPDAHDIPTADQLLRSCAHRRREAAEAHDGITKAQQKLDALTQQAVKAAAFIRSHDSTAAALRECQSSRSAAEAELERVTQQLQSMEDPAMLQTEIEQLQQQLDLHNETQSTLRLLLSVVDTVNASLQSRVAPQLGATAEEIFRQLSSVPGCVISPEQTPALLYLSARLAISEAAAHAPLVLVDALSSLEQPALVAVTQWLRQAGSSRQILLFTSSSREGALFADDPEVLVQELTDSADMV